MCAFPTDECHFAQSASELERLDAEHESKRKQYEMEAQQSQAAASTASVGPAASTSGTGSGSSSHSAASATAAAAKTMGVPAMSVSSSAQKLLSRYSELVTGAAGSAAPGGPTSAAAPASASASSSSASEKDTKSDTKASATAPASSGRACVTLDHVETWDKTLNSTIVFFARHPKGNLLKQMLSPADLKQLPTAEDKQSVTARPSSALLNSKVSLWSGDITALATEAIVNAAHRGLTGGGGVDGAIHRAAGEQFLHDECAKYKDGCEPGEAKITLAGQLPCKWIIHTVGPTKLTVQGSTILRLCYQSVLALVKERGIRSVVFSVPMLFSFCLSIF